jgi:hypothetical protein
MCGFWRSLKCSAYKVLTELTFRMTEAVSLQMIHVCFFVESVVLREAARQERANLVLFISELLVQALYSSSESSIKRKDSH